MATMNVGGRTVEVPNSLNPADAPDTLRAAGPGARPNSFGDAASNAQVKTPAPQLRLPAPEVAKPLFGPHDPVYHGDGRYGAPPNPGATNATAGATQTAGAAGVGNVPPNSAGAPVAQPTGVGGNPGAGVQGDVKRGGLRGVWDSTKAGASTLGGYGKTAVSTLATPKGVGGVAGVVEGYNQLGTYNKLAATPGVTEDQLQRQAIEGGAATIARGTVTAGGAALGGAVGSLAGPAGTAVGAVAGGTLADAGFDNARDRLASAGQALGKGEFGDATKAFFGFPGSYGPVSDGARAQAAAAQPAGAAPTSLRTPTQDLLRVQEARNNIADPGRKDVPAPAAKELRFGIESPTGTFTGGYTDMGGGIAGKSNRRDGKVNDFTNIGADGKPVAMSTMDSRTPDQIANGNRLTAQAAASLRNPDGSKWSANDNAIMAANLRDGIDPYRGTSRGNAQDGVSAGMASIAAAEQKLGVPLGKARRAQTAIDQQGAIAERTNQTTLRGQDMELEGRLAPKRLELAAQQAQRGRIASYLKGEPGKQPDYIAAMQQATANGDVTAMDAFSKLITNTQAAGKGTGDLNKQQNERLSSKIVIPVLDETGKQTDKRDSAAEAATLQALLARRPELAQLPDSDLNALLPKLVGEHTLNQKLNRAKATSSGLSFHGFTPSFNGHLPDSNTLPDLRGAGATQEGFFNGVNTGSGEWTLRGLNGGSGAHGLGHLNADEIAALRAATAKQ